MGRCRVLRARTTKERISDKTSTRTNSEKHVSERTVQLLKISHHGFGSRFGVGDLLFQLTARECPLLDERGLCSRVCGDGDDEAHESQCRLSLLPAVSQSYGGGEIATG